MRSARKKATVFAFSLAVVAFCSFPFVAVVIESFHPRLLDSASIQSVLSSPLAVRAFWFSFWQALLSAFFVIICGTPIAYLVSHSSKRTRAWLIALSMGAFMLPAPVVVTAFATMFWQNGWLGFLHLGNSLVPMFAAHVYVNLAVVVVTVGTAWRAIDDSIIDAARSLGASRKEILRSIVMPLLAPSLCAAFTIAFLFCFASFAIVLLLAPQHATVEVEIYRRIVGMLDSRAAVVLALLQMMLLSVGMLLADRFKPVVSTTRSQRAYRRSPFAAMGAMFASGVLLLPIVSLIVQSLMVNGRITTKYYVLLIEPIRGVSAVDALITSLKYAASASAISLMAAAAVAFVVTRAVSPSFNILRRMVMFATSLPLVSSGVVLGLGYLLGAFYLPGFLRTSDVLVPAAQAAIALPLLLRLMLPSIQAISPQYGAAAKTLGASTPFVMRHVWVPLFLPAIVGSLLLALAISLGDFGATSVVGSATSPTLPVKIAELLSRPSPVSYGVGLSASVLLFGVVLVFGLIVQLMEKS